MKTPEQKRAAAAAKVAREAKLSAAFLTRHARRSARFDGGRLFAQLEIEETAELCRIAGPIGLAVFDALAKIAGPLRGSGDPLEGSAAPTQGELAALLGIDRKTLHNKIALLVAAGKLSVECKQGAKPTWWVHPRPGPVKLRRDSATSADETKDPETARKRRSSATLPADAATKRTTAAPAPPQRREEREREEVGDGELRKPGGNRAPDELDLAPVTSRCAECMIELEKRAHDPAEIEALEQLTMETQDVPGWRSLLALMEGALRRPPGAPEPATP